MIKVKRIYIQASKEDGYRILVDRLWPRGVSKERARLNLWLKEIAPSSHLRQWFSHDPNKWEKFKKDYLQELAKNHETVDKLTEIINSQKTVTLLYGTKNQQLNEAVIIKEFLEKNLS